MFTQNEKIEYVLASLGAVLWIVMVIPQIVKSYRTKSTEGLSQWTMAVWASSSIFFGGYVIAENLNIAIQIQPHICGTLCLVSWAQCCYYAHGYSARKAALYFAAVLAASAAFETTSVFTLWYGQLRGTDVPLLLYGYLSTAVLVLGFAPQYYEIYRLRQVKGISLIFLSIDISGGVLSALALLFRAKLDIIALITYLGVVALDIIILVLYFTLGHKDLSDPLDMMAVPSLYILRNQGVDLEVEADYPSVKWAMTPSEGHWWGSPCQLESIRRRGSCGW